MKTVTRQRTVVENYKVFIADDGKEFNSYDACQDYEARKNGDRITCPKCGGRGYTDERWVKPGYDPGLGAIEGHYDRTTCDKCHGKGYLDKKTTWE